MKHDHLAGWIRFLASPAAPATAMRPVELDGYLTGLIVAPDLIPPSLWVDGIWGDDEPVLDSMDQLQTIIDSVMGHYNAIIDLIDKRGPDHRPMFMDEKGNADLDKAHIWVRGFWQAMALTPAAWSALAEDERTEILVEPFATFVDLDAIDHGPMPDNIDEIRRNSADLIPRVLPALRKLAQIRAERPHAHNPSSHKTGRNQPCPCGSGKKYKRCCGLN
jgi:uncharacterized protein